jgi:L-asparagine transporter-like permease
VAVVRAIFGAALLATVLGLILEFVVPASARIIDIGAAVFGLATWIVPLLLAAMCWTKKRSSLASVGFTLYLLAVAACLSAVGLSLALVTLIFAQDANWAWIALLEIAAFWLSGGILLGVGDRRHRRDREASK